MLLHAKIHTMNDRDAYILRENTNTSGVLETARTVVSILADHDIPHLIAGGIAVQEYGYPRVTIDVDIIVPDVLQAVELSTADLSGPLVRAAGCEDRVEDHKKGVAVDFLPAGRVLKQGCKVPFPTPAKVTEKLQIVTLEDLISLKLDSWASSPVRRHKDKTDVIELISRRALPRDLQVALVVRPLYFETWDAFHKEL
jgi:hypothetical protein